MSKPVFLYSSYIATTPERLWEALTRGDLTRQYWYDRRIESDWKIGSPVRFYDGASNVLTDSGVVLESDRPWRMAYTFQNEYDPQAHALGASRVTFAIEAYEGQVKLTLVHDNLANEQVAEDFREGWTPILSSLKTFLETGKALPELSRLVEQGRPRKE